MAGARKGVSRIRPDLRGRLAGPSRPSLRTRRPCGDQRRGPVGSPGQGRGVTAERGSIAAGRALLVVEGHERIANVLVRGLRAEGYAVTHCPDGAVALGTARTGGFAAIILDIMLPGMSGMEVCQALRVEGDTTPVLLLSAQGTVEQRIEGLRKGGDDHLTKPFAFDGLWRGPGASSAASAS